jgi:hypothetical protein
MKVAELMINSRKLESLTMDELNQLWWCEAIIFYDLREIP